MKKRHKKWFLFLKAAMYFFNLSTQAQSNVGIGTKSPAYSALLELNAASKGLLITQISLKSSSDSSTIPAAAKSLLIFNTNRLLTGDNGCGDGFYYNKNTTIKPEWVKLHTVNGQKNAAKIIWGIIDKDGTIICGSGDYKINILSSNQYEIIFDSPFKELPIINYNEHLSITPAYYTAYNNVLSNEDHNTSLIIQVKKSFIWMFTSSSINKPFAFVCTGY